MVVQAHGVKARRLGMRSRTEADVAEAAVEDFRSRGLGRVRSLEQAQLGSDWQQVGLAYLHLMCMQEMMM